MSDELPVEPPEDPWKDVRYLILSFSSITDEQRARYYQMIEDDFLQVCIKVARDAFQQYNTLLWKRRHGDQWETNIMFAIGDSIKYRKGLAWRKRWEQNGVDSDPHLDAAVTKFWVLYRSTLVNELWAMDRLPPPPESP